MGPQSNRNSREEYHLIVALFLIVWRAAQVTVGKGDRRRISYIILRQKEDSVKKRKV
jgi:hypothetical protein